MIEISIYTYIIVSYLFTGIYFGETINGDTTYKEIWLYAIGFILFSLIIFPVTLFKILKGRK